MLIMYSRLLARLAAPATLLFCVLTACSIPPPAGLDGDPLALVGELDPAAPFAGGENGTAIAWGRDGLRLQPADRDQPLLLDDTTPAALAWSPDAGLLAAIFPAPAAHSRLTVYDRSGDRQWEEPLPIAPLILRWSRRGDLLVGGYALRHYSFGSNLALKLYVFSPSEPPLEIVLGDTTLKPGTVEQLAASLQDVLRIIFTPAGDEVVYTVLRDPPEFAPYLHLLARNWQVPVERSLGRFPVGPIRLVSGAREGWIRVALGDDAGTWLSLWDEPQRDPEDAPAGGAGGDRYRFVNGRLYDGQQLLARWAAESRLQVLPSGNFLLANGGRLYFGVGLTPYQTAAFDRQDWMLRRWLYQGLITPDEYRKTRSRTLP